MVKHYILTRFNIRLWGADKNGRPTRSDTWLQSRFELFERYCLPSVIHQTVTDFLWLVLFDEESTLPYRALLDSYAERCPSFRSFFLPPATAKLFRKAFDTVIAADLRALAGQGTRVDKVITTYLDNDDSLCSDYVERVQRMAAQVSVPSYIVFTYGYQYFTDLNMATRVRYKENHFNSFVEVPDERGHVRTTFQSSHYKVLERDFNVRLVDDEEHPAWVEVIHDRNVINTILLRRRTALVRDRYVLQRDFHVDVVLREHALRTYLTTFQWRKLLTSLRYVWRRLFTPRIG